MNGYQGGDAKRHYKMFKAGKHWAFMAITTMSIAAGLGFVQTNTAQAATDTDTVTTEPITTPEVATAGKAAADSAAGTL